MKIFEVLYAESDDAEKWTERVYVGAPSIADAWRVACTMPRHGDLRVVSLREMPKGKVVSA